MAAIIGRICILALPDPATGAGSLVLDCCVIRRVFSVGFRSTRIHHGGVDVLSASGANGNDPAVTVDVALPARDLRFANQSCQLIPGPLTAGPCRSVCALAGLTQFGRVDAMKPDPYAFDIQRVAINNVGAACQRSRRRFGLRRNSLIGGSGDQRRQEEKDQVAVHAP